MLLGAAVILMPLLGSVSASGQLGPATVQSATLPCAAAVMEYFSQGQGEPVVLLPGSGFGVGYLEPLAASLARGGYQAVRINPRGAGKSRGSLDASYHDRAADVACVVEALRLGPVHLIGHAFGNRVARMLSADRPDLVRSVTLLAAGGKVAPTAQARPALATIYTQAAEADLIEAVSVSGLVGSPSKCGKSLAAAEAQRLSRLATARGGSEARRVVGTSGTREVSRRAGSQ